MKHLVDSKIKLAACVRCGAYVFTADSGGSRVMADPAPLDGADGIRTALLDGRGVFRLLSVAGHPHRLQRASASLLRDLDHRTFVAGHTACGTAGRNARPVEAVDVPPPPSPCDAWRAQGWTPPPQCPRQRVGLLAGDGDGVPVSCGVCEKPPFDLGGDRWGLASRPWASGSRRVDQDPSPGPSGPQNREDGGAAWRYASPMASAAGPGREKAGPTAPDATKRSVRTDRPISTGSGSSAPTGGVPIRRPSGSSAATVSGGGPAPPPVCANCGQPVLKGQPVFAIECGNMKWSVHA